MGLGRFALGTSALGGTLEQKLDAVAAAGFPAIVIAAKELVSHPEGVDAAARAVRKSRLRVSALKELRDFEGIPRNELDYKLEITRSLLQMTLGVGSDLLLVTSSTAAQALGDRQQIAQDLATLGTLATPFKLRIGYRALPWGRWIDDLASAAEVVALAGLENVGVVVDTADMLATQAAMSSLAAVPVHRIFLVQLGDCNGQLGDASGAGAQQRVFPGEGANGELLAAWVHMLRDAGYGGDFALDVTRDEQVSSLPAAVADRARRSVGWVDGK
jgi:sugar phosphate isomerase/epimerase